MESEKTPEEIIQEQIHAEIGKYEEKAAHLSTTLKKKITVWTFTERDSEGKETGKVFACFVQEPHILVQARAMDMIVAGQRFEAGQTLWTPCVLEDHTDKEILNNNKYRLGVLGKLGLLIELQAPDVKKS